MLPLNGSSGPLSMPDCKFNITRDHLCSGSSCASYVSYFYLIHHSGLRCACLNLDWYVSFTSDLFYSCYTALTQSHIHTLTHSLTYSHPLTFTHSIIDSNTLSPCHTPTHLLTPTLTYSHRHSLKHSHIHSWTYSFTHSLTHTHNHSFSHSHTHVGHWGRTSVASTILLHVTLPTLGLSP